MTRMLVSVRDGAEALLAAEVGVDYLDLKEPTAGALGGLPPARIREILGALRPCHPRLMVSATIGDLPAGARAAILAQVEAVADCGVDLVKVGVPGAGGMDAEALLTSLARCARPVVPVFIADDGLDADFFAAACVLPFPALMLDTQGKLGGSLLERMPADVLATLVACARTHGKPVGLAGALTLADLPRLRRLRPDFAGFRSAVCEGARTGRLVADKVRAVRLGLRRDQAAGVLTAATTAVAG